MLADNKKVSCKSDQHDLVISVVINRAKFLRVLKRIY